MLQNKTKKQNLLKIFFYLKNINRVYIHLFSKRKVDTFEVVPIPSFGAIHAYVGATLLVLLQDKKVIIYFANCTKF